MIYYQPFVSYVIRVYFWEKLDNFVCINKTYFFSYHVAFTHGSFIKMSSGPWSKCSMKRCNGLVACVSDMGENSREFESHSAMAWWLVRLTLEIIVWSSNPTAR